jgi:molybdopterin converting factor small subunit
MSLQIIIPTPLRKITANLDTVEVEAGTVNEAIDSLEARFPGFRSRVCDESGGLRRFINIYVNGEDVRFLDNLATPIPDGAELSIVPAIAGG